MRIPIAAAAAVLLAGCEVYAVPSPLPCPGERQGVFDFSATQVLSANDCFFAQPESPAFQVLGSFVFQATVNFGPAALPDNAAVCIQTPHAVPREGVHSGLQDPVIDVAYSNLTGSVGACTCPSEAAVTAGRCSCPPDSPLTNCSCPVIIVEQITGTMAGSPGAYSGFAGTQTVHVRPLVDPLPAPACDCLTPCSYSYDLTANTVGSR